MHTGGDIWIHFKGYKFSFFPTFHPAADFGFARFLQDGNMAATLCGSPMYMVIKDKFVER